MQAILFTGPTLSAGEVAEVMQAECLPPAAHGDVYRAAERRPRAIGIVDGYFERVPAVWHREILWAMSQGIHVFGSASMGALRAAELAAFGMVGVGEIFAAYRDGVLEDDDEVAVAHAPAEAGYRAGSEAMVNIRATLALAAAQGAIGQASRDALLRIAKSLFYPQRSYARALELAAAAGLPPAELECLRRWLPSGAVNQKRDDALAMLRAMRELIESGAGPKRVDYHFEETFHWDNLRRASGEAGANEPGSADAIVLEELRRDPAAWARAREGALGWWLAAERARRGGSGVDAAMLLDQSAGFCRDRGLADAAEVAGWLERNECAGERLERMLERAALAARAAGGAGNGLDGCLLDYLLWTGEYALLLERGRQATRR